MLRLEAITPLDQVRVTQRQIRLREGLPCGGSESYITFYDRHHALQKRRHDDVGEAANQRMP